MRLADLAISVFENKEIVMRDLPSYFSDVAQLRENKSNQIIANRFMCPSEHFGLNYKVRQLGCINLVTNQLSYNQIKQQMANYNFMILPQLSFPTLYYITVPSTSTLDPPLPQPHSIISMSSQPRLRNVQSVQLSVEDLLAAGYEKKKRVWSSEEDQQLMDLVEKQNIPWKHIPDHMPDRTQKMCYSRYRRLLSQARQRWAPGDEKKLKELVETKGRFWKEFVKEFPNKSWKNLRDKYVNFLSPDINRDDWTVEEDRKILELVGKYGTKWKKIQDQMGSRTDNQLKNRYYGRLRVLMKRKARRRTPKSW